MSHAKERLLAQQGRSISLDLRKVATPMTPTSNVKKRELYMKELFLSPKFSDRNPTQSSNTPTRLPTTRLMSPTTSNSNLPTVIPFGSHSLQSSKSKKSLEYNYHLISGASSQGLQLENSERLMTPFKRADTFQIPSPLSEVPQSKSSARMLSQKCPRPQEIRPHSVHLKDRANILIQRRDEVKMLIFKRQDVKAMVDNLMAVFVDNLTKITNELPSTLLAKEVTPLDTSIEIELLVYRLLKILTDEINKKNAELAEAFDKIAGLEQERDNLSRKLAGKSLFDQEVEAMKNDLASHLEQMRKNETHLQYELSKLGQEKSMLANKFEALTTSQISSAALLSEAQNQKNSAEAKVKKLEKLTDALQTKASKFEMRTNLLTQNLMTLSEENRRLKLKLESDEDKELNLVEDLNRQQELANMYRERANMQREDYFGLLEEYFNFQDDAEKMREKITEIQNKQRAENKTSIKEKKSHDDVQKEFQLMRMLTDYLIKPSTKHQSEILRSKALDPQFQHHSFEIRDFSLKKANFDCFFEDLEIYINRGTKAEFNLEFMATIRAIFDSKYNEFLLNPDEWRMFSRFPDFVHSWLGKFRVDKVTGQVRTINLNDPEVEHIRRAFRENLNNKKTYKLWDAITFREFLSETLAQDELVFYLHIRFLLFRGPQLRSQGATFEFIQYINYSKVEALINHVLKGMFEPEHIRVIKEKLKDKVRTKNNRLLIDAAFVLRVLLESYRKIKHMKFDFIRKLIEAQPNISSISEIFSISYRSFISVLQVVCPSCTELEAAELYRYAWRIGREKIDAISVLTALNESGFLIKDLQLRAWIHLPNLDSSKKIDTSTVEGTTCKFICDIYSNLQPTVEAINHFTRSLGVEPVLAQVFEIERFIQNQFQFDEGTMNGKSLVSLILHFHSISLRVNHLETYFRSTMDKSNDLSFIENQFVLMEKHSLKQLVDFKKEDTLKEIERAGKARKLQNFFKKKCSNWYKLMTSLLQSKIKTLKLPSIEDVMSPVSKKTTSPMRKGGKKTPSMLHRKSKQGSNSDLRFGGSPSRARSQKQNEGVKQI